MRWLRGRSPAQIKLTGCSDQILFLVMKCSWYLATGPYDILQLYRVVLCKHKVLHPPRQTTAKRMLYPVLAIARRNVYIVQV